jgi:hypothetical protein
MQNGENQQDLVEVKWYNGALEDNRTGQTEENRSELFVAVIRTKKLFLT